MLDRIRHRGPDDSGVYADSHAFLGHRRLSIVDVARGHQPMPNESRSKWIVYNGEIFNHASLRPSLEQAGHRYENRSDTETIVHAYEEYGADCVQRFRGMFAFALWDAQRRKLFCARDRMGIKPLYYYWNGGVFAFASEIKALLEHPEIPAEFDESVLSEYLGFGYISDDRTFFRGIRKLMPAHTLTLDLRRAQPQPEIQRYWEIPEPEGAIRDRQSDADWIRETRERLEESVRMRLMSDVPLGVFLSGGVDSGAIAALVKRMATGEVKTFSVGYREAQYSELSLAEETARVIGTDHHQVIIGQDEFFSALPKLVEHEDEPIAWPASVPLYFVSKLASREVKVVLSGEGSDELFGGYERYRWNLLNQRFGSPYGMLPGALRGWIRETIATSNLLSAAARRKLGHTFVGRESGPESLFLDNFYCAFSKDQQQRLLQEPGAPMYRNYMTLLESRPESHPLARMLYADQKTYLVELLMKQDQMSMAASIESRVPFLDHTLVEFAMNIPHHLKIRGATQKYLLKKAVADLLPEGLIHRKKLGFPTPLRSWLRGQSTEWMLDGLRSSDGLLAAFVNRPELDAIIDQHRAGLIDATDRLWRLLNLQIWGDVFLTGNADRWSRHELRAAA
jgi:asparagine synthase (glutamine-hydrolysing)